MGSALPQYIEDAVEKALFADAEIVIKGEEVLIKKKGGEMAISRAITRDLKFSDVFKADEIRDLAARITMKKIPPKQWEPKTPQEYSRMYSEGPKSCMSNPPGSNYSSYSMQSDRDIYKATGLWSSSFYAYVPEVQGVCMMIDDKIVTRAFKLPHKLVSSVYGETVHTTKHIQALEDEGYLVQGTVRGSNKYTWFSEPFKVPAIDSKTTRGTVIPIPSQIDFSLLQHYRIAFCKEDEHLYCEPTIVKKPVFTHSPGALGMQHHHFQQPGKFYQIEKKPW